MIILNKIPELDADALRSLEENAMRLLKTGTPQQMKDAMIVVEAVSSEREYRKTAADASERAAKAAISEKARGMSLFDQTVTCFTDRPPSTLEMKTLKALAANPGRDHLHLAKLIGSSSGDYFNLTIGSMCRKREVYFGLAPASDHRKGETFFSGIIVDYDPNPAVAGDKHSWMLKPDVLAALQHLKLV